MPSTSRRTRLVSAIAACFAALSIQPALAAEPVVKAPESVSEASRVAAYGRIDAADFGDMETDPFVAHVLREDGHHHDH